MRVELKKLLEKLGVNRELTAYETHPWFHYDEEKGISCSAEVRMGPGSADLEAEIQFLKDEDEGSAEDSDGGDTTTTDSATDSWTGTKQIMRMRAEPFNDNNWAPRQLRVNGQDYANEIADWEEKGCSFFKACIQAIQMGELPDIDDLIEKELSDDSFGGGKRGRIGRKSPKVKPGALLGMKKPGGGM